MSQCVSISSPLAHKLKRSQREMRLQKINCFSAEHNILRKNVDAPKVVQKTQKTKQDLMLAVGVQVVMEIPTDD